MDLNARVDINFGRVGVNFQVTDLILLQFFFTLISVNTKVPLILHTRFQPNIPSHFGNMNLNARVDVTFFRVDVNFQTVIVT